jgi:hypothetical protein
MFEAKRVPSKALIGSALAVAIAFGSLPTAAQAQHGDITKGVLLGLVAGYAVNQYVRNHPGANRRAAPVYPQATRSSYVPQRRVAPAPTRVYYQPVRHHVASVSPEQRAFNSEERKLRIAIQYNLMQAGYYNSTLDGLWGPATESALYHYALANDRVSMLATESQTRALFGQILQ